MVPGAEADGESWTCEETVVVSCVRAVSERGDVDGVVVTVTAVNAPTVVGGAGVVVGV